MANFLYDNARELFLTGQLNWTGTGPNNIYRVILVDSAQYSPSASHTSLAAVNTAQAVPAGGTAELTSRTGVGGAADAADVTFTNISWPSPVELLIIYKEGTTANDSPLIACIDTATGLPIQPNGGDIIVTWDNGTNKIFKL